MSAPPNITRIEITADHAGTGQAAGVFPNRCEPPALGCSVDSIVKMRVDDPYLPDRALNRSHESNTRRRADMKVGYRQPNEVCPDKRIPAQDGNAFGVLRVQLECRGELTIEMECRRNL